MNGGYMNIIELVKEYVLEKSNEYKINSNDNYDFWNEHIKYVYEESIKLAEEYNANFEIVSLGALLHDIALINRIGDRKDHHINGAMIAKELLKKMNYDTSKMNRVLKCIYNHRSSRNAESIEEICVADADILAHFDNIPMLFNSAFIRNRVNLNEVREWMKNAFEEDYNDLSDNTKEMFREKYELILRIVIKN